MPYSVNDAGVWKTINKNWVYDANVWKPVKKKFVYDAGIWKPYFVSEINITQTGNENNVVLVNKATAVNGGAFSGPVIINYTINPGIYVQATSTGVHALNLTGFPVGSTINLINHGVIRGAGGAGGAGASHNANGDAGGTGGPAIYTNQGSRTYTIRNYGYIQGGGGGGGGGGGCHVWSHFNWDAGSIVHLYTGGGGGGGGHGSVHGGGGGIRYNYHGTAGGQMTSFTAYRYHTTATNGGVISGGRGALIEAYDTTGGYNTQMRRATGGNGGAGGTYGAYGGTGGTSSEITNGAHMNGPYSNYSTLRSGGPGGAPGYYIYGNGYVTWYVTGTIGGRAA